MKQIVATLLIIQMILMGRFLGVSQAQASTAHTWTDVEDFGLGTNQNTSTDQFPGDVTLGMTGTPYTETTKEQFDQGHSPINNFNQSAVSQEDDGEVVISQGYNYNIQTTPAIRNDYVFHSFLDSTHNLLYISAWSGGLTVINTHGTVDPTDDTQLTSYTTDTTPAIGNNNVVHSFLDSLHNLLYVSTFGGGLTVINTQGTVDPADDTLVKTYTTSTTPAIGSNSIYHTFLDSVHNLLYVSTWGGGLTVINTQGTVDPADDTLVKTYTTSTTPAIGGNNIIHTFLDPVHNLLYISTYGGGLTILNTQGTIDPADDTLVKTYTTATTPAIGNDNVRHSFLDSSRNLLYISTHGGGLTVINTQGTVDPADDTLVKTYTTSTTPAIGGNNIIHTFLDPVHNLLYISTYGGGLTILNTQGTIDPADDTLVKTYTTATTPAIGSNVVLHSFLDSTHNLLYLSTGGGLTVLNLDEKYNKTGERISQVLKISDTPAIAISFPFDLSVGTNASIQTRAGDADAAWLDNFDDNSTAEYVGDYYGWGCSFDNVTESNGTMKLSGISTTCGGSGDTYVYSLIDTGKPDGYLPAGSVVTARVRVNSNRELAYNDYMFNDNWHDTTNDWKNNEWMTLKFTSTVAFSKIGFKTYWVGGTWDDKNDNLEIDYIKIELPDDNPGWGAWSTPCSNQYSCPIDQSTLVGKGWLQYKLNLTTADTDVTPSVNSVTLSDGYQSNGTYSSENLSYPNTAELYTFSADTEIPEGTNIQFQYSLDQGSSWNGFSLTNNSYTFPTHTKTNNFQWRANLTTSNTLQTPIIHSVTLTSDQADLSSFSNKTKALSLEKETLSFSSTNYLAKKELKLSATNTQAKNGIIAIYEKTDKGGTKKIKTDSIGSNGEWSLKLKANEGKKQYAISYTDSAGNSTSLSKFFTVLRDTTKPTFETDLPQTKTLQRTDQIDFPAQDELSKIDYYKVQLYDQFGLVIRSWRKQSESFYKLPATLPLGNYQLKVRAYDKAGNWEEGSVGLRFL